jgi:hypothetical protein
VQDFERIVAQKPCILTGDRSYFFSQPIIIGKGLDFAGDLRYAFLIIGICAKFFLDAKISIVNKIF